MPGLRQAWSSFSMAPRQKYGQDRGHVAVSGPMRGQHCRGLDQSQPRVTGTWVWCDKLLCDSIAVQPSYPRVSERERETGPWLGKLLSAHSHRFGAGTKLGRAGSRHPCTVTSPASQSPTRPGRSHIALISSLGHNSQ